jgi:hypothetical protein
VASSSVVLAKLLINCVAAALIGILRALWPSGKPRKRKLTDPYILPYDPTFSPRALLYKALAVAGKSDMSEDRESEVDYLFAEVEALRNSLNLSPTDDRPSLMRKPIGKQW